jgi:hypothetical protein
MVLFLLLVLSLLLRLPLLLVLLLLFLFLFARFNELDRNDKCFSLSTASPTAYPTDTPSVSPAPTISPPPVRSEFDMTPSKGCFPPDAEVACKKLQDRHDGESESSHVVVPRQMHIRDVEVGDECLDATGAYRYARAHV